MAATGASDAGRVHAEGKERSKSLLERVTAQQLRDRALEETKRRRNEVIQIVESRAYRQIRETAALGSEMATVISVPVGLRDQPVYDIEPVVEVLIMRLKARGFSVERGYDTGQVEVSWDRPGRVTADAAATTTTTASPDNPDVIDAHAAYESTRSNTRVSDEVLDEIERRWDGDLLLANERHHRCVTLQVPPSLPTMPFYSLDVAARLLRQRLVDRGFEIEYTGMNDADLVVRW